MTNKERVLAAIHFQEPDYISHFVDFTSQMYEKMVRHTGNPDYRQTVNNHVAMLVLNPPQQEIRPGFFRDELGVIWNKAGVDKDIDVIDNIQSEDPEDIGEILKDMMAYFPQGGLAAASPTVYRAMYRRRILKQ